MKNLNKYMIAKRLGFETIALVMTKGGAGKIHIFPNGQSATEIRSRELQKASKILGVDKLIIGDFPDGKIKENSPAATKWVGEQIEKYQPGIVATYDFSGFSGHPDHIAGALLVRDLVKRLPAEKRPVLLWSTIPLEVRKKLPAPLPTETFQSSPDYKLNMGLLWIKKWFAARSHKSQSLGRGLPVPLWLAFAIYHFEWYHEVDFAKTYPYKYVPFKI